jgi:hypothetical protein
MNQELLKRLQLEAGGSHYPDINPGLQARFAELIVQECADTIQKRYMGDNNREDMEVQRCVEDLKKHFGVEE